MPLLPISRGRPHLAKMRTAILLSFVSVALVAGPVSVAAQSAAIVGTWRGTSTCVDREHFPACKDEQVIYDARLTHSAPDTVAIRADKLVSGAREFMAELFFTRQADSSWLADVRMPPVHFLVRLRPAGDRMQGTMTDVASGRRIRYISVERHPPEIEHRTPPSLH
jgi:hypothetical protein